MRWTPSRGEETLTRAEIMAIYKDHVRETKQKEREEKEKLMDEMKMTISQSKMAAAREEQQPMDPLERIRRQEETYNATKQLQPPVRAEIPLFRRGPLPKEYRAKQLQEAGWASRKDEPYKPLGGRIILDMPHPSQILRHATEDDARDQLILGAQAFKASKILDRRAKRRHEEDSVFVPRQDPVQLKKVLEKIEEKKRREQAVLRTDQVSRMLFGNLDKASAALMRVQHGVDYLTAMETPRLEGADLLREQRAMEGVACMLESFELFPGEAPPGDPLSSAKRATVTLERPISPPVARARPATAQARSSFKSATHRGARPASPQGRVSPDHGASSPTQRKSERDARHQAHLRSRVLNLLSTPPRNYRRPNRPFSADPESVHRASSAKHMSVSPRTAHDPSGSATVPAAAPGATSRGSRGLVPAMSMPERAIRVVSSPMAARAPRSVSDIADKVQAEAGLAQAAAGRMSGIASPPVPGSPASAQAGAEMRRPSTASALSQVDPGTRTSEAGQASGRPGTARRSATGHRQALASALKKSGQSMGDAPGQQASAVWATGEASGPGGGLGPTRSSEQRDASVSFADVGTVRRPGVRRGQGGGSEDAASRNGGAGPGPSSAGTAAAAGAAAAIMMASRLGRVTGAPASAGNGVVKGPSASMSRQTSMRSQRAPVDLLRSKDSEATSVGGQSGAPMGLTGAMMGAKWLGKFAKRKKSLRVGKTASTSAWYMSRQYRTLTSHRIRGGIKRDIAEMEAKYKAQTSKGPRSGQARKEREEIVKTLTADGGVDLEEILQPSFLPGDEERASAELAKKAAKIAAAVDSRINRRGGVEINDAKAQKERREYEKEKEMLDARRFFSNVPPHMLPREKIDTWLAIKQRAHAKRAVVQAMSKEDMKKKLQQRSEEINGCASYEIGRRERDRAAIHHRLSLGVTLLNDLSLSRPDLPKTKDVETLEKEIEAVRHWAELVRLQETRIRLFETAWLAPILAQVESQLRKGVLTDAERIIAVDVVERILDGDVYGEEHFTKALGRVSPEDIYDGRVQDLLTHVMTNVLKYHSEAQVEALFHRAFGPSLASDAMRAYSVRRHQTSFDKNKRTAVHMGAMWKGKAGALGEGQDDVKAAATGAVAAMLATTKHDRAEALRLRQMSLARIRWEFVARKSLAALADANRSCFEGRCLECRDFGWQPPASMRPPPRLVTSARTTRTSAGQRVEEEDTDAIEAAIARVSKMRVDDGASGQHPKEFLENFHRMLVKQRNSLRGAPTVDMRRGGSEDPATPRATQQEQEQEPLTELERELLKREKRAISMEYQAQEAGMGGAVLTYLYRHMQRLKDAGIPSSALELVIQRMETAAHKRAKRGMRPLREVALEVGPRYGYVEATAREEQGAEQVKGKPRTRPEKERRAVTLAEPLQHRRDKTPLSTGLCGVLTKLGMGTPTEPQGRWHADSRAASARSAVSSSRYTPVTRDPRLTSSHVPQTPTTVAQSAPGSAVPGPRPRPFTVGTTKPGGSPAKPKLGLLDPVPSLADAGSHHGTFAKKEGSSASAHRGTDAAVPSEDAATPRMSLFNAPRSSFAQVWAPGSRRPSTAAPTWPRRREESTVPSYLLSPPRHGTAEVAGQRASEFL